MDRAQTSSGKGCDPTARSMPAHMLSQRKQQHHRSERAVPDNRRRTMSPYLQEQTDARLYNETPSIINSLSSSSPDMADSASQQQNRRRVSTQHPQIKSSPAFRPPSIQHDTSAGEPHRKRPRSPPAVVELECPLASAASSASRSHPSTAAMTEHNIVRKDGSCSIAPSQEDPEEHDLGEAPAKLHKVAHDRTQALCGSVRRGCVPGAGIFESAASLEQMDTHELSSIVSFLECCSIVSVFRCNRSLCAALLNWKCSFAESHDSVKVEIQSVISVRSVTQSLVSRFRLHVLWNPSSTAAAPVDYMNAFQACEQIQIEELENRGCLRPSSRSKTRLVLESIAMEQGDDSFDPLSTPAYPAYRRIYSRFDLLVDRTTRRNEAARALDRSDSVSEG